METETGTQIDRETLTRDYLETELFEERNRGQVALIYLRCNPQNHTHMHTHEHAREHKRSMQSREWQKKRSRWCVLFLAGGGTGDLNQSCVCVWHSVCVTVTVSACVYVSVSLSVSVI